MSINKSGTFIYTPDIIVAINTNTGVMDVSEDVIDFSLKRQFNSIASFDCTLSNPGRKYNRVINTMDRITVFLKRTNYIQVFSGYITYAPIETLVPTPITISAQCTLRILKTTYWDNTLMQFQQLLLNYMDNAATSSNKTLNDGGVAQAIVQVLNRVVGWDTSKIHVQAIPSEFIDFAAKVYSSRITNTELNQNVIKEINALIAGKGIISGTNAGTSLTSTPGSLQSVDDSKSPKTTLTHFEVTKAKSFHTPAFAGGVANSPGRHQDNPVSIDLIKKDIYWCSAPFAYFKNPSIGTPQDIATAKAWLAKNYRNGVSKDGRLLLLQNARTNKAVVVRLTSVPQKANTLDHGNAAPDRNADYLQLHPGVIAYLNGTLHGDPTSWKEGSADGGGYSNIVANFVGGNNSNAVTVGPQHAIEQTMKNSNTSPNTNASSGIDVLKGADAVINHARTVIGATYPIDDKNQPGYPSNWRSNPNYTDPKTHKQGLFDCSGLIQWAYKASLNIDVGSSRWPGGNTLTQMGPIDGANPEIFGTFIPPTQMPQKGDILFFDMKEKLKPGHVIMLSSDFGKPNSFKGAAANNDVGWVISANQTNSPLSESQIRWSVIKGGNPSKAMDAMMGVRGAYYMGARRPLVKHASAYKNDAPAAVQNTSSSSNPNDANQRVTLNMNNSFNFWANSPQYDVRASVLQGTPRAFILDNPVMGDLEQIVSAAMRCYQSAPNGDFISWFPDYYGLYGTDPVLEVSEVEIIDFQIYHNDDMLATHVGIIGDTNGIGQNVSFADYVSTNGIVTIQDGTTMQMLFKKVNNGTKLSEENSQTARNFLNKYGLRPYKEEQNMIHSHSMEYMYSLFVFMNKWTEQFISNVSFTFLPELYPGMRIVINIDNDSYQFYCTAVTHQGSRSGGFTTEATLTAPIKNGQIMHYGLDLV